MCWIGKDNRQIAKDDIKVFKIVIGHKFLPLFNSMYQKFPYKIGSVYSSKIKKRQIICSTQIEITNGIHSYSPDCKIIILKDLIYVKNCADKTDKENLDVFSKCTLFNQNHFDQYYFYKLECIIPKRSAYYENDHGEMVSSRLKILKAIKL